MPDGALLGRALHKTKSINVEANILDEWQTERQGAIDRIRFRAFLLLGCVVSGFIFIPLAKSFSERAAKDEKRMLGERVAIEKQLATLEAAGQSALPIIAYDQMVAAESINAKAFLGNLAYLFNATPTKVAISKLKGTVTGGELTIQLAADSEDSESARQFADDAGKGPGTEYCVLASMKKSTVLSADGLGFDIDKKARVGR